MGIDWNTYHRSRQPYSRPSRPPSSQSGRVGMGRGAPPLAQPPLESTESTTDRILRLRLQSRVLISRALEMENYMFQGELSDLREQMRRDNQLVGEHPATAPLNPDNVNRS